MRIESNLSKLLVVSEDLALEVAWAFGRGFISGGKNPIMVGTAFAVNEVVKFSLGKLIENLRRKKLTPSRIKYIESITNLIIDITFIYTRTSSGMLLPIAALINGGYAIKRFKANIEIARKQSQLDYPFTAVNFAEKKA